MDTRNVSTSRFIRRPDPWKRSPVSTSSTSTIRPLRRLTALMACTRNLPSQTNHETICWAILVLRPRKERGLSARTKSNVATSCQASRPHHGTGRFWSLGVRAAHGIDRARELQQQPIVSGLDDATAVGGKSLGPPPPGEGPSAPPACRSRRVPSECAACTMSALPPIADEWRTFREVRFGPERDILLIRCRILARR